MIMNCSNKAQANIKMDKLRTIANYQKTEVNEAVDERLAIKVKNLKN